MTIVVRVFGQGEQSELRLLAFDGDKKVITLVCKDPTPWDQAMAAAPQQPPIKDDNVPCDPGQHIGYHKMLEGLWGQASDRLILKTADSITHRHFYPWLDNAKDCPVFGVLCLKKLLGSKPEYQALQQELWPGSTF